MIDILPVFIAIIDVLLLVLFLNEYDWVKKYIYLLAVGITWGFFIFFSTLRIFTQLNWGIIIIVSIFMVVDIVKNLMRVAK